MIFQSEWKLKHFCEILSEREGTKISWTEPKSDGRFFFLFWNFFFFKRSLMDSSKRKSGPPPIQMQTQTFLQAFIRKGKDQSFSNLNSKVRNLVFFFVERYLMDSSKRKSGPSPIRMQTQTFLRALSERKMIKVYQIWIPKVRNLIFFFFLKISTGLIKEKKWLIPDSNSNSNISTSFFPKGKGSKFIKFESQKQEIWFFLFYFKKGWNLNSKIEFKIPINPFSFFFFFDAKSNIGHQLERSQGI